MTQEARATARVSTDRPQRWAKQLASHLGQKMTVTQTGAGPHLAMTFDVGSATCLLDTRADDALVLEVRADGPEPEARMKHVVGGHLERFGAKERLLVEWMPRA